jgi:hypothetical protein
MDSLPREHGGFSSDNDAPGTRLSQPPAASAASELPFKGAAAFTEISRTLSRRRNTTASSFASSELPFEAPPTDGRSRQGTITSPPVPPPDAVPIVQFGKDEPIVFPLFVNQEFNEAFEEHPGPLLSDLNYEETFRELQIRLLERQRTGTYVKSGPLKMLATVLILTMAAALLLVWELQEDRTFNLTLILLAVFTPISIIVIWTTSMRFQFLIWILVGAAIAFFALVLGFRDDANGFSRAQDILIFVFITLAGVVGVYYLMVYIVWPRYILRNLKGTFNWSVTNHWRIKPALGPDDRPTGYYEYKTFEGGWNLRTRHFGYRGQVDTQMQPHGMGEWVEDSYTGENIRGFFDHGKPIGPFIAREFGTSNQFASVRLAFWRNCEDPWDHNWTFSNSRNKRGPQWGAVRGECSVGGNFFSMYPRAELLIPPTFSADNPDIVRNVFESVTLGLPPVPEGIKREALIIMHGELVVRTVSFNGLAGAYHFCYSK